MTYTPFLIALLLGLTAVPDPTDDSSGSGQAPFVELTTEQQRLQLRVWELLDLAADGASRREILGQLSRVADSDLRPLFDVYAGLAVRESTGPVSMTAEKPFDRNALLAEALGSVDPEHLFDYLRATLVEGSLLETRLRAVELLAGSAHPRSVDLIREVLEGADPVQLTSPQVRLRIENALRAAFESHPHAMRAVAKDPASLAPQLLPLIARAAPEGHDGAGALLLLLGVHSELDVVVIERLGFFARGPAGFGGGRVHVEVVEHVRDRLRHSEPSVRKQALVAMGYLVDPDSIPMQIALLENRDRAVQRAAAWSLERATGMHYGNDAERWTAWYEAELAWFHEHGLESERTLLACPDADAISIIRELTARSLFRHIVSDMLAPVLFRGNHFVVEAACSALKQLRSPHAIGHLVEGLEHADPECRAIIHRTLIELTGLELPASPHSWEAELSMLAQ